jgi:hypothetical protein
LLTVLFLQDCKAGFPEVTIAVVGEENAGKSSFVRCALDMKSSPVAPSNKKKMSLDGSVYIVRLLEVDLAQVQFDQENNVLWPRTGRDRAAPAIDGVLVLHDATKPDRLSLTTNLICRSTMGSFISLADHIQTPWRRRLCRSYRSPASAMSTPNLWKKPWMQSTNDMRFTAHLFPRRDHSECALRWCCGR